MNWSHERTWEKLPLLHPLKEYFGFTSFRPLQEEIIRDALAGRDVLALLPTGGGKSLCFQLPALARPGLTVVVSPLIALMKDQVDALQANGIAATFLNSSLSPKDSQARLRGLHRDEYRLLYIAPERLMLSGCLNDLQNWPVNLLAIDEAHCISEWGHDFRPEYRRLVELRERFPSLPIMALTATATERVRGDIVTLLRLREPACYVASFNRPNLTYRVEAKASPFEQVLAFLQTRTPGKRNCLLPESKDHRKCGRTITGTWHHSQALSCRSDARRTHPPSGTVSTRRGPSDLRDHCLRDGNQQTERTICHSL